MKNYSLFQKFYSLSLFYIIMQQSVFEKADFLNSKILGYNNFCMLSVDQAFGESFYLYYFKFYFGC